MNWGPMDYLVVQFQPEVSHFTSEMAKEVARLVDSGTIRALDLVILIKDADGAIEATEDTATPPKRFARSEWNSNPQRSGHQRPCAGRRRSDATSEPARPRFEPLGTAVACRSLRWLLIGAYLRAVPGTSEMGVQDRETEQEHPGREQELEPRDDPDQ
jgi:hypothetical protein